MSAEEARLRVRIGAGGVPSVWVRQEPDDPVRAALGEVGPDGWAPVILECEIKVDGEGVHFDLSTPREENDADVTGCFPIEHVLVESPGPHGVAIDASHPRGPTGTWPVGRPDVDVTIPEIPPARVPRLPADDVPLGDPPPLAAPDGITALPPPSALARGGLARAWQETSPPRKVLAVLVPFALIFTITSLVIRTRAISHAPSAAPRGSVSAKAAPSPAPSAAHSEPSEPGPSIPAAPPRLELLSPAASSGAAPSSSKMAAKKTLERAAVDAVAAGSYAEALQIYDELALRSPEVPAYRQAARILRAKTESGARP